MYRRRAYHGMLPLLFKNVDNRDSENISKTILNQLKDAACAIAWRNLYVINELLRLLDLFRGHGIRALPFKGPVLAAAAYGNLSLRHFGDLDILMPREDILKAKDVLLERGYQPTLQLSATEERVRLQAHHDYTFCRSSDGVVIEIQWGITQDCFSFPFAFEDLWDRREDISLSGVKVETLRLEDLLLILCVHGAKHRWTQLKWICDIAEIVRAYQGKIDWERLMSQAGALGGERMLLLGLFLAHDLLGAVLPGVVLKKIDDDSQIKVLGNEVYRLLFGEPSSPSKLREEPPLFFWKVRERLRDKLAIGRRYFPEYFVRMFAPNDRDRALLKLPSALSFAYYLVRPFRLIKDFWASLRWNAGGTGKSKC